jgi:hypothetical protein
MTPLHPDWAYPFKPFDFKIEPLSPKEAEQQFLDRFQSLSVRRIDEENK